jgi:hypothetical protein
MLEISMYTPPGSIKLTTSNYLIVRVENVKLRELKLENFGVLVVDSALCDNEATSLCEEKEEYTEATPIAVELGDPEAAELVEIKLGLAISDEIVGARAPLVEDASNADEIPARFP